MTLCRKIGALCALAALAAACNPSQAAPVETPEPALTLHAGLVGDELWAQLQCENVFCPPEQTVRLLLLAEDGHELPGSVSCSLAELQTGVAVPAALQDPSVTSVRVALADLDLPAPDARFAGQPLLRISAPVDLSNDNAEDRDSALEPVPSGTADYEPADGPFVSDRVVLALSEPTINLTTPLGTVGNMSLAVGNFRILWHDAAMFCVGRNSSLAHVTHATIAAINAALVSANYTLPVWVGAWNTDSYSNTSLAMFPAKSGGTPTIVVPEAPTGVFWGLLPLCERAV